MRVAWWSGDPRPVADKVRDVNEILVRSRRVRATGGRGQQGADGVPAASAQCVPVVHVEPVPQGSPGGWSRQLGWLDPTKGQLPPTSPLVGECR